jgi:3-oxoacyl-[acyl-carrier-protein] synthase II
VDEVPCRPFRASRAGLSLGEGAGVLVMERADAVRARGGTPLMIVHGGGSSCDAGHMTAPHPEGTWAAGAIAQALAQAELASADVDYVNAHGTGTPLNDSAEEVTLQRAFGERARQLPVEATKSIVGHLLGAAGAVEAVAVALALSEGLLHPAPASAGEELLEVDLVCGTPRHVAPLDTAVSLNLGFGGSNAALVFGRWHA